MSNDDHDDHGHLLVQAQLQLIMSNCQIWSYKSEIAKSSKNSQPSNCHIICLYGIVNLSGQNFDRSNAIGQNDDWSILPEATNVLKVYVRVFHYIPYRPSVPLEHCLDQC